MGKITTYVVLAMLLFCAPSFAGEKEEIALRIQIVQEHISRLNDSLYFIPFEKKVYEDALKELQIKQESLNKLPPEKTGP